MNSTTLTKYENGTIFTDDEELAPIFDKYGEPTPETLQALYEDENGMTTSITLDELQAWINEL